jgi:hypothetical protein
LVSSFYHFSIIFYGFPKSGKKRKRKIMNSVGLKTSPSQPVSGQKRARARPPWHFCTKALRNSKKKKHTHTLFLCVADNYKTPPYFYFFTVLGPRRDHAEHLAGAAISRRWRPRQRATSSETSSTSLPEKKPSLNSKDLTLIEACSWSRRRKDPGDRVLGN